MTSRYFNIQKSRWAIERPSPIISSWMKWLMDANLNVPGFDSAMYYWSEVDVQKFRHFIVVAELLKSPIVAEDSNTHRNFVSIDGHSEKVILKYGPHSASVIDSNYYELLIVILCSHFFETVFRNCMTNVGMGFLIQHSQYRINNALVCTCLNPILHNCGNVVSMSHLVNWHMIAKCIYNWLPSWFVRFDSNRLGFQQRKFIKTIFDGN